MAKSLCTDHDQSNEQSKHTRDAEVAGQDRTAQERTDQPVELNGPEISSQQLQSGIGGEVCFREFDSKISVDSAMNIGFPSSHSMWPFVLVMVFVCNSIKPQRKAFF
jgi:hypothetical protein